MSKPKVLVIDDDDMVLDVTRSLLERGGMEVECVTNWSDISPRLMRSEVDLVLLDIMMPGLSGEALAPILSRYAPHTRVVLYSGISEAELSATAERLGIEHWLQKGSVTGRRLIQAVQDLLPEPEA